MGSSASQEPGGLNCAACRCNCQDGASASAHSGPGAPGAPHQFVEDVIPKDVDLHILSRTGDSPPAKSPAQSPGTIFAEESASKAASPDKRSTGTQPARANRITGEDRTMEIGFLLPDGTTKAVVFTRRPLGMDFVKGVPITVKRIRPASQSEHLGVQEGWKLMEVDNTDISKLSFIRGFEQLSKMSSRLPHE
mmetsp:Transcript_131505/g.281135  ORF Transcript_131505/g.281135 Transcript_131505/m.281135 type:complete len:193 (-) Transcript_131505:142-720(-)